MFGKIRIVTLFITLVCVGSFLTNCDSRDYQAFATNSLVNGEWDTLIKEGESWIKKDPGNPIAHFVLSIGHYFNRNLIALKKHREIAFKNSESQNSIMKWCEDLVNKNPHNALSHFVLAIILDYRGNVEQAKKNYDKAIELNPKMEQINYCLQVLLA